MKIRNDCLHYPLIIEEKNPEAKQHSGFTDKRIFKVSFKLPFFLFR